MNTEQERADFESWANGRCELHLVNPAGRYSSAITQFAWEAYQAGRAALQSQDQEGAARSEPSGGDALTDAGQVLALLERSLAVIQHDIDEIGGCDHGVGVCCCELIHLADDIRAAMQRTSGGDHD